MRDFIFITIAAQCPKFCTHSILACFINEIYVVLGVIKKSTVHLKQQRTCVILSLSYRLRPHRNTNTKSIIKTLREKKRYVHYTSF